MREQFEAQLRESLYVHRPLPLERAASTEGKFGQKKVLAARTLYGEETKIALPKAGGLAALSPCEDGFAMEAPLRAGRWPEGASPDGDYANFGTARADLDFPAEDWRDWNRLRFRVRPKVRGARILHLNVAVKNEGAVPLPDPYFREGATVFDLENGQWNECVWEFAAMPRDAVTQLCFYVFCSGHDTAAGEELTYVFRDLRLERIEEPEHEHGWINPRREILLSSVGYWPEGEKTAICCWDAEDFRLLDAAGGEALFTAPARIEENSLGRFTVLDFSAFTRPGRYVLEAGGVRSCAFEIASELIKESLWKMLNFLFCERCGFPVPGKHGTCHQDVLANHRGETISFSGGWHDAGDVSQQAAQTAETVLALFENARRFREDRMLYLRLMEEAQWGLDFILRTRFGDGFRATSAGATRFTDNKIGNFDDIAARVHDHAFENFLFAGVEAYAALSLRDYDGALASNALEAAQEDFAFARKKFAETGVDPAHMYEHTYNSGLSQYYAVIVWAASLLFEACGGEDYAAASRETAEKLLSCQEQGDSAPLAGFFYRDESKRTVVHFNHQSREHQFMQALEALCRSQPEAPERAKWERAMRLYGDYLKAIAGNTSPFGMLPAGVHRLDEPEDQETFPFLHVACAYETEKENYRLQLAAGKNLGDGFVLRNFPVWFSFRGNNAVLLSMGKAAAILGNYFRDERLRQIGREQFYWVWGKNPFGQSMIYGAGSNYCRQYAVLCGECVGEIPVGIETRDNEDEPYWPQNNNATFREVWIGSASRWLMLCAEEGET